MNDGRSGREWYFYKLLLKKMPEAQIRFIYEKTGKTVPDIEAKSTRGIAYFEVTEIQSPQIGRDEQIRNVPYGTWQIPEDLIHIGKNATLDIEDDSKKFAGLEDACNAFVFYVPWLKPKNKKSVTLTTKPSQRKNLLKEPYLSPTPFRVIDFKDAPVDFALFIDLETNKTRIVDNKNRNKPDVDKIKAEIFHIFS